MDKKKVILVWFRNDLRLHDNEVLSEAIKKADVVIPVYCFDPRYYEINKFGYRNTGAARALFTIQTVQALKNMLQGMTSDLMTFHGLPEEIIPRLVAKYDVDEVYHHREVAQRETAISENVESALWQANRINLRHFIGHTMYHKEDLPFPIRDIPDSFATFKKKVERESQVRGTLPTIYQLTTPGHLEDTHVASLSDLGFDNDEINRITLGDLNGGETAGLHTLEIILAADYKGFHDFTRISPYMAIGALSPVLVYHRLQECTNASNKKRLERRTSRLLWRDYFRFMLKKYPNVYFKFKGYKKSKPIAPPAIVSTTLQHWTCGTTGVAFIDQAIHVLRVTGNLPYEARTILGLFVLQETHAQWTEAASFFEEHLVDYSPSTTYGHWAHIAGVGTSLKDNMADVTWQSLVKKHYPYGLHHDIETGTSQLPSYENS